MIKYFCDRCGKEMVSKHGHRCTRDGKDLIHMCDDCHTLLMSVKDKIDIYRTSDVEKFCKMSAEDIELLRYTFKVGDKVITDDGRTGTITSICDCERCKKRGFYEPDVEMDFGVGRIWITDTDKENGFANFYQIGDQVFGNVDAEASERIRKRIVELHHEVIEYKAQLKMMKKLENNNGN